MTVDSDYGRVVAFLSAQRLPAFVSYAESTVMHGIPGENDPPQQITVDTVNRRVIEGAPPHLTAYRHEGNMNPLLRPAFDPACYRAHEEQPVTYGNAAALRFTIQAARQMADSSDCPFSIVYVDPATFAPIAATGNFTDSEDGGGAKVWIEERFGTYGKYVLPSLLDVDVHGTGLLFWLRVHAEEHYDNYQFMNTRRQSP